MPHASVCRVGLLCSVGGLCGLVGVRVVPHAIVLGVGVRVVPHAIILGVRVQLVPHAFTFVCSGDVMAGSSTAEDRGTWKPAYTATEAVDSSTRPSIFGDRSTQAACAQSNRKNPFAKPALSSTAEDRGAWAACTHSSRGRQFFNPTLLHLLRSWRTGSLRTKQQKTSVRKPALSSTTEDRRAWAACTHSNTGRQFFNPSLLHIWRLRHPGSLRQKDTKAVNSSARSVLHRRSSRRSGSLRTKHSEAVSSSWLSSRHGVGRWGRRSLAGCEWSPTQNVLVVGVQVVPHAFCFVW